MTMDYGYSRPPDQLRRRRRGFSTRASVVLVLAGFVVCVALIKFAVNEPAARTGQTSTTTTATPRP
jgi:hypothetical protein